VETVLAFLCGILMAASVYLMLSRNLVKFLFGLILNTSAVNLLVFNSGGLTRANAPFLTAAGTPAYPQMANSVPQALILTAIVISFALLACALVMAYRAYQELGTVDTHEMRIAEPETVKKPAVVVCESKVTA
jgi:multicomponent Na+:H+ antiporter subunit C